MRKVFEMVVCRLGVFFFLLIPGVLFSQIKTGLDVLKERGFDLIEGKKVALVVNHTARDASGRHLVDLLLDGKKMMVTRIFAPEHGFDGTAEGAVADGVYRGIPIVSLYGKEARPRPELLANADVVLFDLQDAGARYYTYLATLAYTLEAAREAQRKVIVLDRPNPAGGIVVSGFVPPAELTGRFTSIYPIPTRHGMTIGEIARLFNEHFGIGALLEVVPMKGWKRTMLWRDTGLPWVPPSPNLKTPEAVVLYAEMGWLEAANISVGRGTDEPFFMYGAPFVDGERLAAVLRKSLPQAISVDPIAFTPRDPAHRYFGRKCGGVRVRAYDLNADLFGVGLTMLRTLFMLFPDFAPTADFALSMGREGVDKRLKKGEAVKNILTEAAADCRRFREIRKRYLLY